MIDLRLLGSLELHGPDGTALHSVLAQPKRTALLAYLAVRGGFLRRDSLLSLLWPEADSEHARAALRKALHFLRQSLGEEAIVSRGNEEVGIDPARLRCDAAEFSRALDRGAAARALDLYQGDLLPGFFISGAPEFEQWLETVRVRLREQACGAAWTLAAEAELAGDTERAEQLARRAVALSVGDERTVGKLMDLLHRLGDPAGAVGVYEDFARRLAEEYELEPSPEIQARTAALRTRVRARSLPLGGATAPRPPAPPPEPAEGSTAEPASATEANPTPPLSRLRRRESGGGGLQESTAPPEPAVDADESPLSWERGLAGERPLGSEGEGAIRPGREDGGDGESGPAARRPLRVRRPQVILMLVLVLVVVVGSAALVAHLRSTPAPPASANVVAVLPFSYHGSGEHAYLSEGIVRMLSTNLNGAGELRSVDPRALLNAVDQASADALDAEHGRALAERFGAGVFVLGHIMEAGGRLRITAVVYDQSSVRDVRPIEEVTVEGDGARLFELVDELTARLLAGRSAEPQERLIRLAALTTHSLPALKAYLEGESEYRAGRYAAAIEAFRRAVTIDTSFALAYYRLSGAAHWSGQQRAADSAGSRAVQHSERLARRDRLLVEAWPMYRGGGPIEAERLYRAVLVDYPDDVEAWFQLGEVQFHWGPSVGRPATEAREAFTRVLSFEPTNVGALIHLARIAADEGRAAELDSLVNRILALEPEGGVALQMRALRAFASGDRPAQERILTELGSAGEHVLHTVVVTVATHSGNLPGAVELARLLTAPGWPPLLRAEGYQRLAQLELARGRWSAARADLLAAETFKANLAKELRAAYATFPFVRLPAPELEAIRREVAGVPALGSFAGTEGPDSLSVIYAPYQLYLFGLLSTRLGDPVAALDYAVQLDRHGGAAVDTAFGRELAGAIRAQVAWTGGHAREALQHLGEPRLLQTRTLPVMLNYAKADERFLRAEALRALGQDEEALRWYASFPDPAGYDLIYLAPSHLRRAEIHERRAEREQAAEHYRRFAELWRNADPELQPLVREARRRLGEG